MLYLDAFGTPFCCSNFWGYTYVTYVLKGLTDTEISLTVHRDHTEYADPAKFKFREDTGSPRILQNVLRDLMSLRSGLKLGQTRSFIEGKFPSPR